MIKTLSLLVCLTGLLLSGLLGPQAIAQDWRVHTPFRSVTDLAASNEAVWTATSGGVFSFAPASGEISRYTTSQGLSSVDAAAIAVSAAGRVWIGYRDGVLDALDPASGAVNSFLDIARADQFADRGINRLRIFGDTLMAGTEFGLVLFDTERGEVRDALTVFGSVPPATPVRDVLIAPGPAGPTLWVATAAGLAHAPLSSVNLREPTEWTVETLAAGEAANDVFALAFFEGSIVAGTATDAFVQQADGTWQPSGISGNGVLDFVEQAGRLYATKAFSLGSLDSPAAGTPAGRIDVTLSVNTQTVPYDRPLRLVEGPDGALWLGDRVEGLLRLPDAPAGDVTGEQAVVPEGPFFSLFSDLVFDANGLLWVAGAPGPGTGFYAFDGAEWTTYAGRFEPALLGRDGFASIHVGPDGNVWAGSQGEGLAQVTPEGEVVTYDPQNSSLLPAGNATDFVIVRGIASDADGTLYVSNEITPRPMAIRSPDGTWTSLPAIRGDGIPASLDRYDQIYVDTFGQKWLLPVPSTGTGLIVWDTAGTPTDRTDDRVKYLRGQGSNGQGLPNPGVRAWAQDRKGWVWIGTDRGIAYYFFPQDVISDNAGSFQAQWPIGTIDGVRDFVLRDVAINDIAVDPADRKWVASQNGAWLLSSEGDSVLTRYTATNSPLLSDNVVAVAVDDGTGRVYFATDRGMVSVQGDAVRAAEEADDLDVFPNPVLIVNGEAPDIFVEGLVEQTIVRVLTPDGRLIAEFDAQGGRARWNARDLAGELVPSGVYLVIAEGLNGEGTAVGKIAVVR